MTKYNTSSIVELSGLDHIRLHPSLYIGSTDNPTHLLLEVLDNSLDEVNSGFCNNIVVEILKDGSFSITDTGSRCLPFDQSLPPEKDPPVVICTKMYSSGKFNKSKDDSAYKISVGLHGIGVTAVYALSDTVTIDIYSDKLKANYLLDSKGNIDRAQEKYKGEKPFSTRFTVKPCKKYFETLEYNIEAIRERLLISAANYPKLSIKLINNNKEEIIKGTEEELISNHLGKEVEKWYAFKTEKNPETCSVRFGWDDHEDAANAVKALTTVNLVSVDEGVHVNKINYILKNLFSNYANKYKYEFQPNDIFVNFRLYINLKIVKTGFESQIKTKLSRNADISIMDKLEDEIDKYFKNHNDELLVLLEKFQSYRKSIQNKKILKDINSKKRGSTKITKLVDCISNAGELYICEGDSAMGGLKQTRDPKMHALLPLRGVIANGVTKKDLLENKEVQSIIDAIGTGIDPHCDIDKIRYKKIIIMADADAAGYFITCLCIILFAKLMPDVIKKGHLYVAECPLQGYGQNDKFVPLWNKTEVETAKTSGKHINYYKGLGSYNPSELKKFAFDSTIRHLIQVKWSEKIDKIFELFSSSTERRNLVEDNWKL